MTIKRQLYVVTFLVDATCGAFVFAVGRLLAEESASLLNLGVVGAGAAAGWAIVALPAGQLSDRCGRRFTAVLGASLLLICTVGSLAFQNYREIFLAFYFFCGIGAGASYAGLIPWFGDLDSGASRKDKTRTLMMFCFAWNLGLLGGKTAAGLLFVVNAFAPIVFAVLLSVAALILLLRLPSDASAPESAPELALPAMATDQRLSVAFGRMCWVANIAGTCCVGIVMYLLSDLAVALDVSAPGQGLILGVMRVAVMVTYLVMHRSAFWHHRLKVIIGARLLGLAGLAVVCVATGSLGLLIGLSSLGCMLGFNYFSSLYYATSGSSDCRRGRACAVVEFTLSLGIVMGTLLGGFAGAALGVRAPYQMAFVVVVVMFILELLVFLFYVAPVHAAFKKRIPDTSNKDK
ncbi:MAG: MFS transporter [Lentisphaeria bacterium]|jgi:MFS family permease|nr:MFS transporter [Lentisphaeria bacterium]